MLHHRRLLTLPEQIAEQIKEAIILGKIKPGEKLPSEAELAERFDVSRPTIRDAVKILAESKLITTKAGAKGGHFVCEIHSGSIVEDFSSYITLSLSQKEITLQEVTAMRKIVEIESCSMAAALRTEKDLLEMQQLLQVLEKPLPDRRYYELDVEFHRTIAKATQNRLILLTIDTFNIGVKPFFYSVEWPEGLKREMNQELFNIYEAIKSRDSQKASDGMARHLQHSIDHFSMNNRV